MSKSLFFAGKSIIIMLVAAFFCACGRPITMETDNLTEKILFALAHNIADDEAISAVAQIYLVAPGGAYPARVALIAKKPAYLRVELLPLIGPPDFFLVANPKQINILLPAKGEFMSGKPTGRNLARFLPWPFDIEEIVAVLAGTYPPVQGKTTFQSYPAGESLRVEFMNPSGCVQKIWISPQNRLLKLIRFDEQGKELYQAIFEDHDPQSRLARKISVFMADGLTSFTFVYTDLKTERTGDLSLFNLDAPAGFRTIFLD